MALKHSIRLLSHIAIVSVLSFGLVPQAFASYEVSGIHVGPTNDGLQVQILGATPPTYTVYELFDPVRVVVDIADAGFSSELNLPYGVNQAPISSITGRVLADKEPAIAKLEILLTEDRTYSVTREGNNIQVVFAAEDEKAAPEESAETVTEAQSDKVQPVAPVKKSEGKKEPSPVKKDLVADLLESIATPEGNVEKQLQRVGAAQDQFASAGFKKQKISVDFYKIDLHNVFRLFGEISDTNMIIDEGVSGTLTLALNEVPWDFAMDIILNLKGLQKEERYNTIVISPKSKAFMWPEEPEKELEIKAPPSDVKIAIEQRLEMPEGMLEAKKKMFQAQKLEKEKNFVAALGFYEEAFQQWSENGELARRIAALCLVDLGMNAKALHYAQQALKLNADDREAALQAAVASANMRKSEAKNFFEMAVSGKNPTQEALVSYASYAEQNGDVTTALALLARQAETYGDSLESMIARARIYDRKGLKAQADAEYRAILYSGYELDADLKRYVQSRTTEK